MRIKSINNCKQLKGKRVLLRVDFNVPLKNGRVVDDYRIVSGLGTIKYLLGKGAKVIIAAHLGEPKNGYEETFSLKPVAAYLQKLLKTKIRFISEIDSKKITKILDSAPDGEIIFLENLRFNKGELSNEFETEVCEHFVWKKNE